MPNAGSAFFYFKTNKLGFDAEFLGRVHLVAAIANLAGTCVTGSQLFAVEPCVACSIDVCLTAVIAHRLSHEWRAARCCPPMLVTRRCAVLQHCAEAHEAAPAAALGHAARHSAGAHAPHAGAGGQQEDGHQRQGILFGGHSRPYRHCPGEIKLLLPSWPTMPACQWTHAGCLIMLFTRKHSQPSATASAEAVAGQYAK